MKIAIIGSGIAGMGAALALRPVADVVIFEKDNRAGGHSHTVKVGAQPIDTGFIVYNTATYPNLIALFNKLGVATELSDMSFAVSLQAGHYEYAGDNFATLIGHWHNLLRFGHWQMIADLVRFMKMGDRLCAQDEGVSLGEYLTKENFSAAFQEKHLLPMAAAIWSAPPKQILEFPAKSFGQFFRNHGLLEPDIKRRPLWRTVSGGSLHYVTKLLTDTGAVVKLDTAVTNVVGGDQGATLHFANGTSQNFDHVIIATHADEALAMLAQPDALQKELLSAFRYSANTTFLHSDARLMPWRRKLWASWNYVSVDRDAPSQVFVSYWMNRLQNIKGGRDYFVTLNPPTPPHDNLTHKKMIYHHPLFNREAMAAQKRLGDIQGRGRIWLCGSYFGYGFHEDALSSGLDVATQLGAAKPW